VLISIIALTAAIWGVYSIAIAHAGSIIAATAILIASVSSLCLVSLAPVHRRVLTRLIVILFCALMFLVTFAAGVQRGTPLACCPLCVLSAAISLFYCISIVGILFKRQ